MTTGGVDAKNTARIQVRPVVPVDEDRYHGRRRRPTRHNLRMLVMMAATAVIGFVLLVVGISAARPAHKHAPREARLPAATSTAEVFNYPPDTSGPVPTAGASSAKPSNGASHKLAPPPAAPNQPPSAPPTQTGRLPALPATFEAESGNRSGTVSIRQVAGASGGAVVTGIGDGAGNTLTVNVTGVPNDGKFQLTIFYIADGVRSATLSVNGDAGQSISFPSTGDPSTIRSVAMTVTLHAGANTLRFGNEDDPGPEIDKLIVR